MIGETWSIAYDFRYVPLPQAASIIGGIGSGSVAGERKERREPCPFRKRASTWST
jgi:hypothetical protein